MLRYPVILPETIEPTYSDLGQRFVQLGLPPFRPQYVTDDFQLARRIVRGTDAFYPLMHTSEDFGGLGTDFAILRDAIGLPQHHLCVAHAPQHPRTPVAEAVTRQLLERFGAPRARSVAGSA